MCYTKCSVILDPVHSFGSCIYKLTVVYLAPFACQNFCMTFNTLFSIELELLYIRATVIHLVCILRECLL